VTVLTVLSKQRLGPIRTVLWSTRYRWPAEHSVDCFQGRYSTDKTPTNIITFNSCCGYWWNTVTGTY